MLLYQMYFSSIFQEQYQKTFDPFQSSFSPFQQLTLYHANYYTFIHQKEDADFL